MQKTARRTLIAGATVATISLAVLLSQFDFSGPGEGGGESESLNSTENVATTSPTTPPLTPVTPPPEPSSSAAEPNTSELITIVVVGNGYTWGTNDATPAGVKSLTLDEIIAKAKETKGNAQGLRARVFHAGSALPSAENKLIDALKSQAGLSNEAILFEQGIIQLD